MCKEACKWQVRGRRRVAGNVGVLHAVAGPWGGVAWPQRSKERASAHVRGPSAGVQVVLAPADQAAIALGWEKGGITVRHSGKIKHGDAVLQVLPRHAPITITPPSLKKP